MMFGAIWENSVEWSLVVAETKESSWGGEGGLWQRLS